MSWLLVFHLFGVSLWIGGGFAAMVTAIGVRSADTRLKAGAFRLLGRVHALVIAPGALLTVFTGLWLTMSLATGGAGAQLGRPGLVTMQGAGIVAGILVVFVGLPTATMLSRLATASDDGQLPPAFERLRKRQAVVSSVAGVLALIALAGARVF